MILYQVVSWMNERKRLSHMIRFVGGDVKFLIEKRRKLDDTLVAQLQQWNQSKRTVMINDLQLAEPPPATESMMLTR